MTSFKDTYTFAIFLETDFIYDAEKDDWGIIAMPDTNAELRDDDDATFELRTGLFGADMTDFSEDCYTLYEDYNFNVLGGGGSAQ